VQEGEFIFNRILLNDGKVCGGDNEKCVSCFCFLGFFSFSFRSLLVLILYMGPSPLLLACAGFGYSIGL